MKRAILSLALSAVCLGGCATKHFGHVAAVSDAERVTMSCEQIEAESLKVAQFDDHVRRKSKIDAASVLAFMGDFGLGNAISKHMAVASATKRQTQLQQLSKVKGCPSGMPSAAPSEIAMK